MSSTKNNALNKAKKLIELLNLNGIEVFKAYVFGSAIQGVTHENSDIDIAIVSKDFTGIPFYDVQKISKYRRAIDLKLEVHPFSMDDILVDPSLFFSEIQNKGIPII
ncbi:MAG: nucleotidyltransferase domain-containing protein [Desulfobacula sp.]|uniref:nucleotidyltransferase domain-containing protein n=1 Tax=Desulfobacula sp. TaxID=2593537 RepID=UPI0025C3D2D5|nr:nucleotidyltransferase domain-containing protein [Desulfobacula sp.]MCD4720417.1 nucleotidyltransferase domain-containing protein [Desulfobacula sp.]